MCVLFIRARWSYFFYELSIMPGNSACTTTHVVMTWPLNFRTWPLSNYVMKEMTIIYYHSQGANNMTIRPKEVVTRVSLLVENLYSNHVLCKHFSYSKKLRDDRKNLFIKESRVINNAFKLYNCTSFLFGVRVPPPKGIFNNTSPSKIIVV